MCFEPYTKSTSLDGIPSRFLRDGAIVFKDHLAHIINMFIHFMLQPILSLPVLNHCIRKITDLKLVIIDLLVY